MLNITHNAHIYWTLCVLVGTCMMFGMIVYDGTRRLTAFYTELTLTRFYTELTIIVIMYKLRYILTPFCTELVTFYIALTTDMHRLRNMHITPTLHMPPLIPLLFATRRPIRPVHRSYMQGSDYYDAEQDIAARTSTLKQQRRNKSLTTIGETALTPKKGWAPYGWCAWDKFERFFAKDVEWPPFESVRYTAKLTAEQYADMANDSLLDMQHSVETYCEEDTTLLLRGYLAATIEMYAQAGRNAADYLTVPSLAKSMWLTVKSFRKGEREPVIEAGDKAMGFFNKLLGVIRTRYKGNDVLAWGLFQVIYFAITCSRDIAVTTVSITAGETYDAPNRHWRWLLSDLEDDEKEKCVEYVKDMIGAWTKNWLWNHTLLVRSARARVHATTGSRPDGMTSTYVDHIVYSSSGAPAFEGQCLEGDIQFPTITHMHRLSPSTYEWVHKAYTGGVTRAGGTTYMGPLTESNYNEKQMVANVGGMIAIRMLSMHLWDMIELTGMYKTSIALEEIGCDASTPMSDIYAAARDRYGITDGIAGIVSRDMLTSHEWATDATVDKTYKMLKEGNTPYMPDRDEWERIISESRGKVTNPIMLGADINSSYPASMAHCMLPGGKAVSVSIDRSMGEHVESMGGLGNPHFEQNFHGYYHVRYAMPDDVRVAAFNISPGVGGTRSRSTGLDYATLYSEEIIYMHQMGYDLFVYGGISFQRTFCMRPLALELYESRAELKKQMSGMENTEPGYAELSARSTVLKSVMNTLYGAIGSAPYSQTTVVIPESDLKTVSDILPVVSHSIIGGGMVAVTIDLKAGPLGYAEHAESSSQLSPTAQDALKTISPMLLLGPGVEGEVSEGLPAGYVAYMSRQVINVGIAAAITSTARLRISDPVLRLVTEHDAMFMYTDTDSLYVLLPPTESGHLEPIQHLINPSSLGALGVECQDAISAFFISRKLYTYTHQYKNKKGEVQTTTVQRCKGIPSGMVRASMYPSLYHGTVNEDGVKGTVFMMNKMARSLESGIMSGLQPRTVSASIITQDTRVTSPSGGWVAQVPRVISSIPPHLIHPQDYLLPQRPDASALMRIGMGMYLTSSGWVGPTPLPESTVIEAESKA